MTAATPPMRTAVPAIAREVLDLALTLDRTPKRILDMADEARQGFGNARHRMIHSEIAANADARNLNISDYIRLARRVYPK